MLGLGNFKICLNQVCEVGEHVVSRLQKFESWVVNLTVSEAFEEGRAVERDKLCCKLHCFHLLVGEGWWVADLELVGGRWINFFFLLFLYELGMLDLLSQYLLKVLFLLFLDFLRYFFTHFDYN